MSQIFKVSLLNNDKSVKKIYAFVGSRFDYNPEISGNVEDLFAEDPNHEIFSAVFTDYEKGVIAEEAIDVSFVKEALYLDDTLGTIKLKLLNAIDESVSVEEMYLFTTVLRSLNPVKVFETLTQNNKLELSRDRMIQFLSNCNGIDIEGIEVKDTYDYNDILGLDLQKGPVVVKEPVGQKFFVIEGKYLYTVNPFDALVYDEFLEKYADNTITTLNADLLLDSLPMENNMLYLCLADDVFTYATEAGLSPVTTTKIYFPFLLQKGITNKEELQTKRIELADASKLLVNKKTLSQFKNVALFYDIYNERKTELNYTDSGINYINFILHPPFKFNLPLDTIFKLVHATQTVPLIKYNPGPRQEKIYKLYTSQVAKNGKKIPYLSKGTIFRLMRTIGKSKKVSVYAEYFQEDTMIPIVCDFSSDGTIQVTSELHKAYPRTICEEIMRGSVNPIIETIKDFLEQSGYEISLFKDFAGSNIEMLSMRYFAQLSITKNIHVDRYLGCLSSIFNVLESELKKGIIMRYKRVANYNEMDNITAFMTEKLKVGMGDAELVESLIQNFTLTVEEARQRLVDLLNEFQVEQGLYENKRLRIRNNPGFPVKISQDKFKSNIFVEADNIDDIYYLDTIPIYLDSLIRITQDISSTAVPKQAIIDLCKQAAQKETYVMEDIVAPAEHPLESNFSPNIVAQELQFEETPAADSDNLDDLLDFMGESEEEEEELLQSKGSPTQQGDDGDGSVSSIKESIPSQQDVLPKSVVAEVSVPTSGESDNKGSVVDDLLSQTLRIGVSSKKGGAGTSSSPESVVDDDWMDDILDFVPPSDTKEEEDEPESLGDLLADKEGSVSQPLGDVVTSSDESLEASADDVLAAEDAQTEVEEDLAAQAQAEEEEEEEVDKEEEEVDKEEEEVDKEGEEVDKEEEEVDKEGEEADEEEEAEEESSKDRSATTGEKESEGDMQLKSSTPDTPFIEPAPGLPAELASLQVREIPIIDVDSSSDSSQQASVDKPATRAEEPAASAPASQPKSSTKTSTSDGLSSETERAVESLESGSEIVGQDIEELVGRLSEKAESSEKEVEADVKDDEDDLIRNIDGMSLSNPNPVFTRLHDNDPTLFLTQDVGKFKQYSRACPWNVRRQPILLTEKEKENIDRNHPGSYENAIKYGSDPDNQFYYICPRYWCLLNNTSLTEQDVKEGKCGGQIIPRDAKKVPPGKYILEFNHPSEHIDEEGNYIPHHPGFLKNPNPDGKCIPCCFKNWAAPEQQKRREECASDKGERIQRVPSQKEMDHYIKSADKVPLDPTRWGYLPISVQKFLHTDNLKCQVSHNNHNIKPFHTCILRHGVEISEAQSFVACIADLFVDYAQLDSVPSIVEMKRYIADAVNLDNFVVYQNGTLITEFQDKDESAIMDTDTSGYSQSKIFNTLDAGQDNSVFYMKSVVNAYENFMKFLSDDEITIDYTYLWDIVCMPNERLFPKGLNLVILQQTNYDITDNIEIICPSNHYANSFYEVGKSTLIILKTENYYEPIYAYKDEESRLLILKTFNEFSNQLLPNIRNVLGVIKRIYKQNCRPLPSMPRTYRFKTNIMMKDLIKKIGPLGYIVERQVLNYQGKVIGLSVSHSDGSYGFVPCFPSSVNLEVPYVYMDDPSIWNSYSDTVSFLASMSEKGKGEILSKPVIKVIDDGLIVGVITETNQFVAVDPPNENIVDDGLNVINGSNFIMADTVAQTDTTQDIERKTVVKNIELESNFYNVFRNSMRILLNDPINRSIRGSIEETIDTDYIIYSEKLKIVDAKLRELGKSHITFTSYDQAVLDNIDKITGCINNSNEKCESKSYCMVKPNSSCNLVIPKNHLVTGLDNERIYYGRLADEIIRYSRIRHFIFEPKEFLNFDTVNYNLWPTEIILLQSLLSQEYFDNLVPMVKNPYVTQNTYDTADPIVTQSYANKQNLDDIHRPKPLTVCEPKRKREISGKWESKLPSNAYEFIFAATPACTFSLMIMIIKNKTGMELEPFILRRILLQVYDKYLKDYKDQMFSILTAEGKKIMIHQVFYNQLTFENLVMSESYYLTLFDMWLLSEHYDLSMIFLSGTTLVENNDSILITKESENGSYYIVKAPGIQADVATKFRLISLPGDKIEIPVGDLPASMRTLISNIITRQSDDHKPIVALPDFIKGFEVIKRKRKPKKKLENFVVMPSQEPPKTVPPPQPIPDTATAHQFRRPYLHR
jgi:hypothetical protein